MEASEYTLKTFRYHKHAKYKLIIKSRPLITRLKRFVVHKHAKYIIKTEPLIKRLKRLVTYKHTKYITILFVQKFQVSSIVCKDQLCTDRMAAIARQSTSVSNQSMRTKTGIPRFLNLVPRVHWLFGQREGASRDSVACSRRSDSGARAKNKASERAGKKTLFRSLYFSLALHYLNAWNRLRLWDNGIFYPRKRGIPVLVRMIKFKTEVKCPKMAAM